MKISDEISLRSSVGTWLNGFLNVAILYLTVELVYLNQRNLMNTQRSSENSSKTVQLLEEIKERMP